MQLTIEAETFDLCGSHLNLAAEMNYEGRTASEIADRLRRGPSTTASAPSPLRPATA